MDLSKQKPKFKGLLTTGNVGDQKVYAIKPLTFMNNSGICIRELLEYFKMDAEDVIVFHDDLDVEFGKIKAKFGGSSAGHNGIASIDKFIGKDYSRVRIGIGKPDKRFQYLTLFLNDFTDDEKVLEYINSNDLEHLAPMGTSCPDHFLRTKIKPLILNLTPEQDLSDKQMVLDKISDSFEQYRDDYREYYHSCKHKDSPAVRDANPVVILYPGVGMFTFAKNKQTARVAVNFISMPSM